MIRGFLRWADAKAIFFELNEDSTAWAYSIWTVGFWCLSRIWIPRRVAVKSRKSISALVTLTSHSMYSLRYPDALSARNFWKNGAWANPPASSRSSMTASSKLSSILRMIRNAFLKVFLPFLEQQRHRMRLGIANRASSFALRSTFTIFAAFPGVLHLRAE